MTYETNKHKIITSPGKFEGEMYFVPELWDLVLNGGSDLELYDEEYDYNIPISIFKIDQELINKYPELSEYENAVFLALWENDSGFVFCEAINKDLSKVGDDFKRQLAEYL